MQNNNQLGNQAGCYNSATNCDNLLSLLTGNSSDILLLELKLKFKFNFPDPEIQQAYVAQNHVILSIKHENLSNGLGDTCRCWEEKSEKRKNQV